MNSSPYSLSVLQSGYAYILYEALIIWVISVMIDGEWLQISIKRTFPETIALRLLIQG